MSNNIRYYIDTDVGYNMYAAIICTEESFAGWEGWLHLSPNQKFTLSATSKIDFTKQRSTALFVNIKKNQIAPT